MTEHRLDDSSSAVTVVIPARNAQRTLEHCIRSIRDQDYSPIELIVVDNGSGDRTREIASEFGATVISVGTRRGIHRNVGVLRSSGRFILYADSDMALEQGLIRECVNLAARDGFGALVIPEVSLGDNYWGRVRAFERNLYIGDPIMESPRFLERSWYERAGGFRESLTGFEDMALTNELRRAGCSIGRTNRRIYHDEGRLTLGRAFKKKRFWGRNLPGYREAYPTVYRIQARFRGAWTRNPAALTRHPLLALGLVPLKVTDALGLLVGSLDARRPLSEQEQVGSKRPARDRRAS